MFVERMCLFYLYTFIPQKGFLVVVIRHLENKRASLESLSSSVLFREEESVNP